ncbi:MAG: dipeptide ABC transporter ATP-binding protein [Deltaproteobacteria bacterium]|nr:dipeptide ABC transporter ATP-binding protein [Deltaproteobacteria bacterium]
MSNSEVLVRIKDLVKHFALKGGFFSRQVASVKAVNGVSLDIKKGETVGLVGESGCGKSTLGRMVLRLLEPSSGEVYLDGKNIYQLSRGQMLKVRRRMQIIFQDPFASLNPRMTIKSILGEPLSVHKLVKTKKEKRERLKELLDIVGLRSSALNRYPHEFSGGQRQRIGIARALAVSPDFIVADEPVSALDVSIQAQIINLMKDLQRKFQLAYLFVAHDLNVVEYVSDRVAVMYLGYIVELAPSDRIYKNPMHPYTQALLSAIPQPDPDYKKERIRLHGDIPSPINLPSGCVFHTRCHFAIKGICKEVMPKLEEKEPGHWVACHLV